MMSFPFFCIVALLSQSVAIELSPTYSVTWTTEADRITFNIEARAKGWIGLGFNIKEGMAGADIVIAGVDQDQKYIHDMHSEGFDRPSLDIKRDYELLKASENATHTALTIRRPLGTNDKSDYTITGEPLYLLWAYHNEKDAADAASFPRHSDKGQKPLTLLNSVRVR